MDKATVLQRAGGTSASSAMDHREGGTLSNRIEGARRECHALALLPPAGSSALSPSIATSTTSR